MWAGLASGITTVEKNSFHELDIGPCALLIDTCSCLSLLHCLNAVQSVWCIH